MIQLGPEIAEIEFAKNHYAPDRNGTVRDAEVTVLPCGLVHIRPPLGQAEFTVSASAIAQIRWNPFNRVIDYGPKTVLKNSEDLAAVIREVGDEIQTAVDNAAKKISRDYT